MQLKEFLSGKPESSKIMLPKLAGIDCNARAGRAVAHERLANSSRSNRAALQTRPHSTRSPGTQHPRAVESDQLKVTGDLGFVGSTALPPDRARHKADAGFGPVFPSKLSILVPDQPAGLKTRQVDGLTREYARALATPQRAKEELARQPDAPGEEYLWDEELEEQCRLEQVR